MTIAKQARGEIRSLTGLRGVAAVFVVIFHDFKSNTLLGPAGAFLAHGYLAVDLFFVLSGFVLSLTYADSFAGPLRAATCLGFLRKRLGRILPLYACVLAATLVLAPPASLSAHRLLANALMIQGWGLDGTIVVPSWSISTEFAAYLLFPVLVWAALGSGAAGAWASAALACAALGLASAQSPADLHQVYHGVALKAGPLDVSATATAFPLLRCLGGFVLGMLAYRLAGLQSVARLAARPGAALLVAAAVLVGLEVPGDDVALVLLFVPLVIVLAAGDSGLARLLSRPVVHWLGLVSYSIYLTQELVQTLLLVPLTNLMLAAHVPHAYSVAGALLLGITVAVAALTYHGIERPARDWARRLTARPGRLLAAADGAGRQG